MIEPQKYKSLYDKYLEKHKAWSGKPELAQHVNALPTLVVASELLLEIQKGFSQLVTTIRANQR